MQLWHRPLTTNDLRQCLRIATGATLGFLLCKTMNWNYGVFFTVTLPLAWPGLIAGCVLAFAKALGEFGATITFVSNIPGETQTLSSAIYGLMQVPGGEAGIWRLAAVAVAISLAALLFSEWLVRRHPTRHGEDG